MGGLVDERLQHITREIEPALDEFLVAFEDAVFVARDYGNYNFNWTPYVVVACYFIVLTIPLARFTDWLGRRMAARERAGT